MKEQSLLIRNASLLMLFGSTNYNYFFKPDANGEKAPFGFQEVVSVMRSAGS
ncbi:hypothetical protein MWU78_12870 [Arenibacter sp. F26102]|uniref:hypothetical protein n=1 Tax=Arenibacter sp. F26102 TaxID=2926416 RepID=UPI001FF1739C|nr:hypothetical protein [Arenibacter sp. F26102]MCK0146540.1 hypothetical protein [Arenibacter sp. F26102]